MSGASLRAVRPGAEEFAAYYGRYVDGVPDGDIMSTLEAQGAALAALLGGGSVDAAHRYEAGKWSVAEVLGHICDAERVFAYRILRIARGDGTPLASFDENAYAANDGVAGRPLEDLLAEFGAVRGATVALLRGLSDPAWDRAGTASGYHCTVRGVAWIIAGHALHHERLLRERYGLTAAA